MYCILVFLYCNLLFSSISDYLFWNDKSIRLRNIFYLSRRLKLSGERCTQVFCGLRYPVRPDWAIFGQFLTTIFLTKVFQIYIDVLGYFKMSFFKLKLLWLFLPQLSEKLGYFLFQHLVTLTACLNVVIERS